MKLTPRSRYNLVKSAIYTAIAIVSTFLFLSCGSRKVETNKQSEKTQTSEKTKTNTKEQIKETVTTTIDTTIQLKGSTNTVSKPVSSAIESDPLVYEDDYVRSETSVDAKSGVLKNKVIRKDISVPVEAKSVTERKIEREIDSDKLNKVNSEKESKVKSSERTGHPSWIYPIIGFCLFFIILFFAFRKRKEDRNV